MVPRDISAHFSGRGFNTCVAVYRRLILIGAGKKTVQGGETVVVGGNFITCKKRKKIVQGSQTAIGSVLVGINVTAVGLVVMALRRWCWGFYRVLNLWKDNNAGCELYRKI